jgi:ABC-2 type transport system ATP-binding protein
MPDALRDTPLEKAMAPTEYVIQTTGLAKSYPHVAALKPLDLRVPKNSIFGFLGPNGAGKTTTIKLLLGLCRPTAGSGQVFGRDIRKESIQIRRRVGYLAQDPRYYEHMSARETLRFTAGFFYSGPRAAIEERIEETLTLVGLEDRADRPIKGFSGGERQRLGIAQAQVNYPDLLILDEPAASLDPQGRRDVLEVMERLRKYATVFYSTHILDDVQRVSDTVAILNRGELVALAPIEQLLTGPGGLIYQIRARGLNEETLSRVSAQPWVKSLSVKVGEEVPTWDVAVSSADEAEAHLLRLVLADPAVRVVEFGRRKHELEEVFLNIVEGGQHGH